MEEGEEPALSAGADPSFEVASEASVPPHSSSMSALMGCAATFLQVPWTTATEPLRSVFRMQALAPRLQPFPAFPDFMEEVRSSWDRPTSARPTPLISLKGAEKLGLAGFSPVDATISTLGKAPPVGGLPKDSVCTNPQCRVTETHLKQAYAAEAQVTRLANTAGILTAYMDGILQEAPLPKPMASELCLLLGTLLQISGLQGGRELRLDTCKNLKRVT
ncbi:UNVERIFIED_CONTAM: hypothetical protein FKN15_056950 [Acipenser sinensis]